MPSRSRSPSSGEGHRKRRRVSGSRSPSRKKQVRRRYRRRSVDKAADEEQRRQANAAAKARRTQEEEELALEVAEAVKARVEEAMKSEAVAQRIQTRLTEERAKLEEKVSQQLQKEKEALMDKKRREQEERQRKQLELEQILEDNRRRVEDAQRKAADDRQRREKERTSDHIEAVPAAPPNKHAAMNSMEIDETDGPASRHNSETRSNFKPEHFRDHTVIGKGKDSIIYSAFCDRIGDAPVAIKVYNKAKLSTSKLRAIKREAAMMIYMSRKKVPLITLFHCAFQDSKHIYIVMEHCTGGDLLERLLKEGRAMHEHRVALEVAHPLLSALAHMHQLRIIHRDIKLENIFLDGEGRVKLGDFGLTMSMKQELAISPVGTVEYMAPEIVALPAVELVTSGQVQARDIKACDEKVDIWALGVTLYELLTGHLPFSGKDKQAIKKAIAAGQVKPMPASLSGPCAAFVEAMLTQDPLQRPSAEQLLQHPFLQMYLMRRQGKHQQPAAVAAPPVQDREPKPPRVEELLAAGSSLSDSFTSLDSRMRELQSREGSATSQMSLPLLPPSFTLRHNEVADSTLPEATVVKIECGARDSTDSLIRARHAALMECGSSTSSGSSMSLPAGQFDLSTAAGPTNSSPSKSRNLRMKKSPLQVETRSASADQMRAMTTSRSAFLPQPGSPTLFRKVGLYFKSMLGRDELPEKSAVSADQLQLPTNSHSRAF